MVVLEDDLKEVIVIGGGAAGMMAAWKAATDECHVTIIEKNEKLGKKVFITGKGRCNITNACPTEDLFVNIVSNPKFLYSSIYSFTNEQVMDFFQNHGCLVKVERGNRVFPVSDKSSDVIRALERELKRLEVTIRYRVACQSLVIEGGKCMGIELSNGEKIKADAVIVATGGCSYASTGSTGDGYRLAEETGHQMTKPQPALVPLVTYSAEPKEMMGLALKNVEVSFYLQNKPQKVLYREFGEMLFTHFGLSGPIILSASCYLQNAWNKGGLVCSIDLKPALSETQLDERILRDFQKSQNSYFKNSLVHLLPKTMIPIVINRSGIDPDKKVNVITKEERMKLVSVLKHFELELKGTRSFDEAIITHGGVKVNQMNPSTLESKLIKDLYFAGEVLDLDAVTGGFNLQIAWSTGYLAGLSAAES